MLTVDAKNFVTKLDTHNCLRAVLGEDNYIGSNLDALHDRLTMIFEPTTLVIKNWSFASKHLGAYADRLWHVLSDSTEENPNLTVVIE